MNRLSNILTPQRRFRLYRIAWGAEVGTWLLNNGWTPPVALIVRIEGTA